MPTNDHDVRKDFVVEIRVVYPNAVSQHDLECAFEGSTKACAHSLIGIARQLPKDYKVTVAGFAVKEEHASK